jgi:predicted component of type VI protein secretion system
MGPAQSILDFGLPAARGTNLATAAGRKEFGLAIKAAVICFEPRLRNVEVSVEPGLTSLHPLRLVIAAEFTVGSDLEPIRFVGSWASSSGQVSLEEDGS